MDRALTCPVCDGPLEPILGLHDMPVMTTALWPSADGARSAPRGDLDLAICSACALIRNTSFDPSLVEYTAAYENSQHFSPTFQAYARELAQDLADRYPLAGATVLEVGCGKGEFLSMLCELAGCRGVGFDPSYDGEIYDRADAVTIVREPFGPVTSGFDATLVCCRHVLEHIEDPVTFLAEVRASVPTGAAVYFEVPDGEFVLSSGGLWDVIYPHVSYFTRPSLDLLFRRCGFEVTTTRSVFGGQFLAIEATAAAVAGVQMADPGAVGDVLSTAQRLAGLFEYTVGRWRDLLGVDTGTAGTALWGAGAKGVSFLNVLRSADHIDFVVDVNPRKQGSFVPGTAQEVVPPGALAGAEVGRVLVMNPAYRDEIHHQLDDLALSPEILCV